MWLARRGCKWGKKGLPEACPKGLNTAAAPNGEPTAGAATNAPLGEPDAAAKGDIIQNTKMLLKSLNTGDFESFSRLCEPEMTSFQPETVGNLVQGVDFYKFYFDHHKR